MENTNRSPKEETRQSKLRGRPGSPPWERPALLSLLVLTAVAYIWGLGQSGWANSFYSAAVQAGTKSWKAFFFGSIDASNFITVDKPPASLWIMELSSRIFGFNSWSMLVPEALMGVASVWVLYMTIRRWFSAGAALLAGTVLAMTPVATLMFRFNNPDALLVLLLTASAYAFTRALEEGKTKWLVWASICIGFGFLTKMMAAFLIIPVFVVVYLMFAPVSVRRRLGQLVISAITVVVSAGWWVAIVALVPAANRPYIGSSQSNSILDLILGYNGLGRLTGNESGMSAQGGSTGAQGGGMGGNFSGSTGLQRLFNSEMGGQISWLIPAALILLIIAIWLVRRNWKTDRVIPAMFLWAGTFFITGIVFSFSQGTIHPYYTVALAPAIGAMIGIGIEVLWSRREQLAARLGLAAAIALTALWSFSLLNRTSTWHPWLKMVILIVGGVAAIAIVIGPRLGQRIMMFAAAAGLAASLAGPLAYTIQTIATPHTGSMPSAGPTTSGDGFPGSGKGFPGNFEGGQMPPGMNSTAPTPTTDNTGSAPSTATSGNSGNTNSNSTMAANFKQGGSGGTEKGDTASKQIVSMLQKDASKYTWVAATVGSQTSATYQLASDEPVMDIGGFTGSDPTPTFAQFKKYISEGKIHYYISGGGMNHGGGFKQMDGNTSNNTTATGSTYGETNGSNMQQGPMGGSSNSDITNWVQNTFKSTTVDGVTIYDLTQTK